MNPTIKALWLQALRSGEYKKTEGSLYYSNPRGEGPCHCALGVLCEEAAKLGIIEVNEDAESYDRFIHESQPDHLVPLEVAEWAELGEFTEVQMPVSRTNDQIPTARKSTFEDVANLIEENF